MRAYVTFGPAVTGVPACAEGSAEVGLSPRPGAWPGGPGAGRIARMLSYTTFFLGSTGVAGALTGLLFVSVSIAPERLRGEHASVEQQTIAATAFTALVDALWISLFALRPGNNIPTASLVLGLIGLTSTAGLTIRLWRARGREKLSNRWPFLLLAITGLYGPDIDGLHRRQQPGGALGRRDARVHFLRGLASRVPGNCLACAAEACLT